ncbi:UDP-N-acetylmuramoyl-L-alanine--D-glutamate ligase [Leptospirillum ferriphilum]|uniref:UDP-N-acetylmuramoylalanine--D-glutamate ligase n=1 Tax=Leptospirillum ferriphilum TaxID=178606 RepID=A0A1V3SXP0_9BACT|nr:UDP-N-acetylmuramoyl-L-alanine--D-glutamate ligase [Leptospirillum ferriphilum]OOH73272.1 UDP-N-acetylmuramoylalanine--D-glutamate ligase [Leptospirillum ferriphilum]OOH79445.1 UDP-N-acetylmuramoylalanine--D-glutamate ligase [Leptospirillum ferriphilum]
MTEKRERKLPPAGETITVIGAGRSGVAAARLARALGYRVRLLDEGPVPPKEKKLLQEEGVEVQEGRAFDAREILSLPFVIVSPGVPPRKWAGQEAPLYIRNVMGEMEWASSWTAVPLVAVGGTNGKSTTSALLAHFLEAAGERVFLGGNFGTPLSDMVLSERRGSSPLPTVAVVELSSFQAETMGIFRPVVNLLLNITPDHLDRYLSVDHYRNAKWNAFQTMEKESFTVLNRDPACGVYPPFSPISSRLAWFYGSKGSCPDRTGGLILEGDALSATLDGIEGLPPISWNLEKFPLEGMGNRQNLAASLLGAVLYLKATGKHPEQVTTVLEEAAASFRGLPHRMEVVGEWKGIRFINDSKATNVDATRLALEGYAGHSPFVHLILGGRDKGAPYAPLREGIRTSVKSIAVLGEARDKIREELGSLVPLRMCESLEEAVDVAAGQASEGDRVLLSPACSSYDMFHGYEERGAVFRSIVENWIRRRERAR